MQPDFDRSAAAMVAGTQKAIAAAVEPLLKRIEALESRPLPERGEKGDPGPQGEPGRDGVGMADALIDRDNVLVLTLTSGEHRRLGEVVGKNGVDGEPGKDGEPGRDGRDGKDGRDGFDLEAFDVEAGGDGRTVTLKFQQGSIQHTYELDFPVMIYRGVFKQGQEYSVGDTVTWAGHLYYCNEKTGVKPGDGFPWQLAVKKGADGKDAK